MSIEEIRPIHWKRLTSGRDRNATPEKAVALFEKNAGDVISVIEQEDGSFALYLPCGGDQPRWLRAYLLQEEEAVFAWISEFRGRLIPTAEPNSAARVRDLRSPWDDEIEKSLAHVQARTRATRLRARGKGPSLLTLWRCYLFLSDWYDSNYDRDETTPMWRFNRVVRQLEQLCAAIARAAVTTPAEIKIKLEFLELRYGAPTSTPDVRFAVQTASRALNRLSAKPKANHQEEIRHAA